jgi:hypothetical protein
MTTRLLSSFALAAGLVVMAGGHAFAQPGSWDVFSTEPIPAPGSDGPYIDSPTAGPPQAGPPQAGPNDPYEQPPIPPDVEAQVVAGPGGSYCYGGPHPADTRTAGGPAWDESPGPHTHFYPPFDLRLFTLRNGCYYFVGDPTDFGYRGQVFGYYGAHPILEGFGGGWCFMIGGHSHAWQPWSASFVVRGNFSYWDGAYDNAFWSYWPYYSHYYRSYYPRYYGGGRFVRGHQGPVAPRIDRVPSPGRNWRNSYPTAGMMAPGHPRAPGNNAWNGGNGWNGGNAGSGNAWRGGPPGNVAVPGVPAPAQPMPRTRYAAPPGNRWSAPSGGGAVRAPTPVAPSGPATRAPTPVPSAPPKTGGGTPGHVGGARGGWR